MKILMAIAVASLLAACSSATSTAPTKLGDGAAPADKDRTHRQDAGVGTRPTPERIETLSGY